MLRIFLLSFCGYLAPGNIASHPRFPELHFIQWAASEKRVLFDLQCTSLENTQVEVPSGYVGRMQLIRLNIHFCQYSAKFLTEVQRSLEYVVSAKKKLNMGK